MKLKVRFAFFPLSEFIPVISSETASVYDSDDKCDDLISRLDNLVNIAEDDYPGDDYEFPRLSGNSIGDGDAAYGEKGATWIRTFDLLLNMLFILHLAGMHDADPKFQIFGSDIGATDINQGALGNCYLLAAFAGLADINNGFYIKNLFETKVRLSS